ncbi:linamarin synthase 2-like [Gossypium arboreum]|nr:linamarin synthase 2-like [Gossypium arboreum]
MGSIKSHAVCLPSPAQGHINPMMQLAKLLHSRGFHITFVNTEFYHRRFIRSRGEEAVKGLPHFRFEATPDGLPPSDSDATVKYQKIIEDEFKHCGWNSILEALSEGVPLICWPFFGDQQTNCRYVCTTWGNGMEINPDIKRENVEDIVKEMMEGDNGQKVRQKALEWKKKAEAAISLGGSVVTSFDRMINEALSHGRVVKS